MAQQRTQLILDFLPNFNIEKLQASMRQIEKSFAAVGENIDLEAGFEDAVNALQSAIDDVDTEELQRQIDDVVQTTEEAAKTMGDSLQSAFSNINTEVFNAKLDEALTGFDTVIERFGEISSLGGVLQEVAAQGAVLGESISDPIGDAIAAMTVLSAKTGKTGDDLEALQAVAKRAFLSGVGESAEEAATAIANADQLLGNFLDTEQIEAFTTKAAQIGKVFDKDVNEVIGGSRTFIAQFGLEGEQAGNLVALGMQKAGSKMDDLLDTLDEYSGLTKQAGFSAEEFIGVLTSGLEQGARDTDKLADAIKETQIRLNAGDTASALREIQSPIADSIKAIVSLGEQGQLSVKEVLQQSTAAIKEAFDAGEINSALRDKLGVAISGTMAEDIGGELYTKIFSAEIDTDAITERAQEAGDSLSGVLEERSDEISTTIVEGFERVRAEAIGVFAPFLEEAGGALEKVGEFGSQFEKLKKQTLDVKNTFNDLKGQFDTVKSTLGDAKGQFGALKGEMAGLFNPTTLGVAAGVAALTYFFAETEEGQKIFAELKEKATEVFEFFEPLVAKATKAFGTFGEVLFRLGEAVIDVLVTPFQVGAAVLSEIIELFSGLDKSAQSSGDSLSTAGSALDAIVKYLKLASDTIQGFTDGLQIGKATLLAFIGGSQEILSAFSEFASTALNPVNWFDGDVSAAKAKLTKVLDETVGKAAEGAKAKLQAANLDDNLAAALTIKEDLDKNKKIDELVEKFNKAKTAAEKASIAEKIKEEVPGAVKSIGAIADAQGKVTTQYEVSAEKVTAFTKAQEATFSGNLKAKQSDILKGIEAQSNAYDNTVRKQKELADQIVKDAAAGKDTEALKKKYEAITKTAEEKSAELKETIEKGAEIGVEFSQATIAPAFQQQFEGKLTELRDKAAKADVGKALTEAAQIQGSLDKQDKLGSLVEQFKEAGDEVEKNSIAKKIAAQMPEVVKETIKGVDANGELIKSYEVATDKVEASIEVSKKQYSGDLRAKQVQFTDGLQKEGLRYQENLQKAKDLAEEIQKKKAIGVDTTQLEAQLKTAQENIQDAKKRVVLMGKDYEKMGLDGADAIGAIAQALNKTTDEAEELLGKQEEITQEAKITAEQIGRLAQAFTDAQNKQSQLFEAGKGAFQQTEIEGRKYRDQLREQNAQLAVIESKIKRKIPLTKEETAEQEKLNESIERTKELLEENTKQQQASVEQTKNALGERRKLEVVEANAARRFQGQFEARQRIFSQETDELDIKKQQLSVDLQRSLIEQQREESDADRVLLSSEQLYLEKEKLSEFEKQFKSVKSTKEQFQEYLKAIKAGDLAKALKLNPTIGAKPEEKEALVQQAKGLIQSIEQLENDALAIRLKAKLDDAALERMRIELRKQQFKFEFDVGVRSDVAFTQLSSVGAQIADTIRQLESGIRAERSKGADANQEYIEKLEVQLTSEEKKYKDLAQNILSTSKNFSNEITKEYDLAGQDREKAIARSAAAQERLLQQINDKRAEGDKAAVENLESIQRIEIAAYERSAREYNTKLIALENERFTTVLGGVVKYATDLERSVSKNLASSLADVASQLDANFTALGNGAELYARALNNNGLAFQAAIGAANVAFSEQSNQLSVRYNDIQKKQFERTQELNKRIEQALEDGNQGLSAVLTKEVNAVKEDTDRILAQINANKERLTLEQQKTLQALFTSSDNVIRQQSDRQLALVQSRQQQALAFIERSTAAFQGAFTRVQDAALSSGNASIDAETERRTQALEKIKDSLSDEAFARKQEQIEAEANKRKQQLEREHQNKLQSIESIAQGTRLQAQREADTQRLQILKATRERELELANKLGQTEAAKNLGAELEKINGELAEKGDILRFGASQLQEAVTDSLSNLFAGDIEGAKEPFRKLFGVIGGALSKLASAVVIDTVLKWLSIDPASAALPLPIKLGLIPVVTGVVQAGISALLAPAINSLTSFASGGRVDEPTLAMVGDGARLGESNREWIFRDQQLQTVIYQAATAGNDDVVRKLDEVVNALTNFSGRIHVTEREIYEAGNKERSRVSRRAR